MDAVIKNVSSSVPMRIGMYREPFFIPIFLVLDTIFFPKYWSKTTRTDEK